MDKITSGERDIFKARWGQTTWHRSMGQYIDKWEAIRQHCENYMNRFGTAPSLATMKYIAERELNNDIEKEGD